MGALTVALGTVTTTALKLVALSCDVPVSKIGLEKRHGLCQAGEGGWYFNSSHSFNLVVQRRLLGVF